MSIAWRRVVDVEGTQYDSFVVGISMNLGLL